MLCYCTNVPPSGSVAEVRAALVQGAARVRDALLEDDAIHVQPMGVGLYLSAAVMRELDAQPDHLHELAQLLRDHGLYCHTLNGFPYGDFHAARVKEKVYQPDWATPERLAYTCSLADALSFLMGEADYASISTVALGWRPDFWAQDGFSERAKQAAASLMQAAWHLHELEQRTGKRIVLSLEAEPFTALETTADVLHFFQDVLWPEAPKRCDAAWGIGRDRAHALLQRYIGVCYDCCHQAVEFEAAAESLAAIRAAGIAIGKVQLSNALRVLGDRANELLKPFAEERYLHQSFVLIQGAERDALERAVRELASAHPDALPAAWRVHARAEHAASDASARLLVSCVDLPETFALLDCLASQLPQAKVIEVRTHFHVPLFWDGAAQPQATGDSGQIEGLGSTQAFLCDVLAEHAQQALSPHLEIETYTWQVLPDELQREDLPLAIAREWKWVQDHPPFRNRAQESPKP